MKKEEKKKEEKKGFFDVENPKKDYIINFPPQYDFNKGTHIEIKKGMLISVPLLFKQTLKSEGVI